MQTKSAADRYDLFRQRARKIISQREQNSLSDSEVQDILRSVKSKLSEDDERKLKEMLEKQVKKHMKETGQSTSMSWRLTTRLQVTCALVANRLKVAAGDTVQKKDRKDRNYQKCQSDTYQRGGRGYENKYVKFPIEEEICLTVSQMNEWCAQR